MGTSIFLEGKVFSVSETEYKGEKVRRLVFIDINKDNGTVNKIDIKILDEHNNAEVKDGSVVRVPIAFSAMDRNIYYRTSGKIQVQKQA